MAKTCPKCRQENNAEAQTCIACGWELGPPAAPAPAVPPAVAAGQPGQPPADSENLLWAGRASYLAATHQWILYLLACVAVLILFFWVRIKAGPDHTSVTLLEVLVWIVILPPGLWLVVKTLYLRWSIGYRLTEQRLFIDRGILGRITDQTELFRVDDVQVRQGPVQRLLGLGDVIILSTDVSNRELVIGGIKNPAAVAEHVRTQMRTLRKQRTLYIEPV